MSFFDLNHGALAPVQDEVDLQNISIHGRIPRELNGMLVRNGPNPLNGHFEGNDVLSWWPEAAIQVVQGDPALRPANNACMPRKPLRAPGQQPCRRIIPVRPMQFPTVLACS